MWYTTVCHCCLQLVRLAKRLKKEKVCVDIINFGEEVNIFFLFPSDYSSKGWEVTASLGGSVQPYLCALAEIKVSGGEQEPPPP